MTKKREGIDDVGKLVSADLKLIWSLPQGTRLRCIETVVMTYDQSEAFTIGKDYTVQSSHPDASPAYLRLVNNQGQSHKMDGAHVRRHFKKIRDRAAAAAMSTRLDTKKVNTALVKIHSVLATLSTKERSEVMKSLMHVGTPRVGSNDDAS